MGYRIIDQTSQGNAMSAYGTARGFRLNVPLLALVAGSLVLAAVLVFLFLRMPMPLPEHTVFLIAARPAALNKIMTLPALKRDLPAPWRAVLGTNSHVPALFGVALDNERRPYTFAVVPKTTFIGNPPGLVRTSHGFYYLLSIDVRPIEVMPLRSLPLSVGKTFENDATFFLRGDLLEAWAFPVPFEEDRDAIVRGVWKDKMGHLEIRDAYAIDAVEVDASLFSLLSRTNDSRTAVVAGLLSQGVDLRRATLLPTLTSLSVSPLGNRALMLTWPEPLSEEDRALLPAATDVSADRQLTFLDTVTTTQETIPPFATSDCPGIPRFVLEGDALMHLLMAFHVPESWSDLIHTIRLHRQGDEVLLCVNH